ncbi:MAG: ImmA/IrrE family metallo-endopeptidase [Clostridia bacterium]|nr:ImmA/IrrE family metallo-endopeptidase [Clostridia bacterium]
MTSSKIIVDMANRIVKKYGTRDPFKMARMCGAELIVKNLGSLKGFYKVVYDTPFIFLNTALDPNEARLVCAHELGHHALHRAAARVGFEEFSLFSQTSRREYEANLFAAALLISDQEVKDLIECGYTAAQIAALLGIDERIAELKINTLL